ncbi:Scr1 family TA system antitoxin-like transcriptional regulator [Streptosporangium canum]|uniref:Scr1 family TA system antitoxin-like transcriptional regulator n=1 Tax=Streptosporangium canum TaxID=324952 RepID=UPI00341EDDB0
MQRSLVSTACALRGPYRPSGGLEVMKEQLEHLVSMTDERLSVQVIPRNVSTPSGVRRSR